MASLVIGVAGAVVGGMIGGPLGASIGWSLGAALGQVLDPQQIEGPRLNDRKLQGSSYGQPIPIVYGAYRLAGQVIWQTELQEHEHKSGGKGGPEYVNYTYSASYAVGICEGPVAEIRRIWADGRLIRDPHAGLAPDLPITIYLGTETQLPDPTIESDKGVGEVPGFRGMVYVVFTDHDLSPFGNRLPNLEFEVFSVGPVNCPIRIKYIGDAAGSTPARPYVDAYDGTDITIEPESVNEPVAMIDVSGGVGDEFRWVYVIYPGPLCSIKGGIHRVWCTYSEFGTSNLNPGTTNRYSNFTLAVQLGADVPDVEYIIAPPYTHYIVLRNFVDLSNAIPAGNWLAAIAVTADQSKLFVFTSTTGGGGGGDADTWWKLVDGVVVDSGTIDVSVGAGLQGIGSFAHTSYVTDTLSVENNGRYIWHIASNNFVRCYWIDDSGHMSQVCTAISLVPDYPGVFASGPLAYAEGYCVIVADDRWAIVERYDHDAETHAVPLSDIVGNISYRAGLAAGEYDTDALTDLVTGYCIPQRTDARAALTPLQAAYFFDACESDGTIRFVKRGGPVVATITADQLAAHVDGEALPPAWTIVRKQEVDLPRATSLSYANQATDYQPGTQLAQRQTGNGARDIALQTALVLSDEQAKRIVDALLYAAWWERNSYGLKLARTWLALDPGDPVAVDGRRLRIVQRQEAATGVIALEAVPDAGHIWLQAGAAGATDGGFIPPPTPTLHVAEMRLLAIPAIATDYPAYGIAVAICDDQGLKWPGGAVYQSKDDGVTWEQVAVSVDTDTIGVTDSALPNFGGGNVFDRLNSVTVILTAGSADLESVSELQVLNGANLAAVGSELIQFTTATLVTGRTYTLSGLLRGRLGTEWAMATHDIGESFVLMPTALTLAGTIADVGRPYLYKVVPAGSTLALATSQQFINDGASELPYSAVQLGGGRNGAGDVTLTWVRRERHNAAWVDYVDVPQEYPNALWIVDIWSSSSYATNKRHTTLRVAEGDATEWTYTAAMQTADFGSTQSTVYWTVTMLGAAGTGPIARGIT